MRAILIDPTAQSVTEIDFDGDLVSAYSILECDMVQEVPFALSHVIICDEEGLLKPKPGPFWQMATGLGATQPIAGKSLIVSIDRRSGLWGPSRVRASGLQRITTFPSLRFLRLEMTNTEEDHPVFGKIAVIRHTPIFEEN